MMNQGDQPDSKACSSSPCSLHELEARGAMPAERTGVDDPALDWADVRLWRRAKRQVLIERRLAIPAADRAVHRAIVTAAVSAMLVSRRAELVGFYWPFKGEFDPRPMVQALQDRGMRFALPVVLQKAQPLIFREWRAGMKMGNGIWDIPVPAEGEAVAPDAVLVPLVGFDKRGYRLGYGGGYYDRTLASASVRPWTIGVGFERLEIPTIHPQPHDIRMDCIVTERRCFEA